MYAHRAFVLKVLLAISLVYFVVHFTNNTASTVVRKLQQSGRNLAALDPQQNSEQTAPVVQLQADALKNPSAEDQVKALESDAKEEDDNSELAEEAKQVDVDLASTGNPVLDKVKEITKCLDRPVVSKTQQRGDYWVLYNYVPGDKTFKCHESITYTTHGDFSFLDNLVPLVERWQGPISIALHAPGSDFKNTIDSIAYLRECTDPIIRQLVTFHIYFSTKHVPKEVPKHNSVFTEPYNCSSLPPYFNVSSSSMYKAQKKLLYPVNVGRNVAREMAQTHFLLASDIELYPSPNVIPQFLEMIADNAGPLLSKNPKVYPFNIFEVGANQQVPENKTMLKEMLSNGTALPFHKKLCPGCHSIPKAKEWQAARETKGLHVFHVGKRNGRYIHWEPVYIGTHADPLYDERLSWEGKSDKMTQGYALCVLDYDFLIIDNAFLVHKPGIKVYKHDARRNMLAAKTNQLIKKIIFPELKVLYGVKKGCAV